MNFVPRIALLSVLFWACTASTQDIDNLVRDNVVGIRAFTEPDESVWYTQQTKLHVEVRTQTWFTEAPKYPELKLDGAITILPSGFATNRTESSGRETYTIQRRTYLIFPQRTGLLSVPPISVRFKTNIDGESSSSLTLVTEPLALSVKMPPKTSGLQQIVTTPALRISDRFDRELDGLKVGDAINRTVTISGTETLALMLPQLSFVASEGVAVYTAQPILSDETNRGQYSGERVESVSYILEKQGNFIFPEIEVSWWNPQSESLMTETLEARNFSVQAAPYADASSRPADDPANSDVKDLLLPVLSWIKTHTIGLTLIVTLIYLLYEVLRRILPATIRRFVDQRSRYEVSEKRFFRDFERACDGDEADTVVSALWAWLDRIPSVSTVPQLARQSGVSKITDEWDAISAGRYGSGGVGTVVNIQAFKRDIGSARREMLRKKSYIHNVGVGRLNPRPY